VLRVEVDEAGLLEALLAAGRISEAELDNRACLESAAAEILIEWRRRWVTGDLGGC
jgi:hypothetical protein